MTAREGLDRVVAGAALVLLSPVMAAVAVAVKLDSRGPVLFRQVRVGRGGRPFTILKFRSMRHGTDPGRVVNVSPANDPRVTRVGRVIRGWYLDELPQFLNVLAGDMSLVGPRPETPEHVAMYTLEERRVLELRPGLVGPSTLAFMNEAELLAGAPDPVALYTTRILHERVRLDLQCLDGSSLGGDLALLARQARAILRRSR